MAGDQRRCTASQFFDEEERVASEDVSTYDKVVELLNKASLMPRDNQKLTNLRLVKEYIIYKEPNLLDNFLDEMLAFLSDRSAEVKKFVIQFMEDACKVDAEILTKVMGHLNILLNGESVPVIKKVILVISNIYRTAISWIGKSKNPSDLMLETWKFLQQMKSSIAEMIDSDNDGIRTHAIKFLESISVTLSRKTAESEVTRGQLHLIGLDSLPESHPVLKMKKLEEEGEAAFTAITTYQASPHISSVNLMTCMGSMTAIAKLRPQFLGRVVQGFESLHVNLPPTLSKSQVSSVRKNLKMQMLSLLRLPASFSLQPNITTLLTDLGATQTEVMKAMPKMDERKRKASTLERSASEGYSKKPKIEIPATPLREEEDDYSMTPYVGLGSSSKTENVEEKTSSEDKQQSAIDITAEDLMPRLTPQNVADLVLLSMVMLPETSPPHFQATYTPIAAAGTQAQIKHLARLLATQLTAAGLGKGVTEMQQRQDATKKEEKADDDEDDDDDDDDGGTSPKHSIQTIVDLKMEPSESLLPLPTTIAPHSQTMRKGGIKTFKLSSVTQPINSSLKSSMVIDAFRRILDSERASQLCAMSQVRTKLLISLVAQFGGALRAELREFIFEDLRNRADLALSWMYQEYAKFQGYCMNQSGEEKYDECLTRLLEGLLQRPDQREGLFSRLLLEAPYITPSSINVLREYCQDETRIYLGMTTLKELIVKRPCMKLTFLDVLLDFTSHENLEVRNNAIRVTKTLHELDDLSGPIEKYALFHLKFLLEPKPPMALFSNFKGRITVVPDMWAEDTIKLCLYLYLGLLPINHSLIHELANVYTSTHADIKRTILRVLESPVKGMGMESPQLLKLVETCPKGAETLITRVIHILTDKVAPSPELVERVRDLYHKRVSDVRFLIPVLNGLSKKEVVAALPKLIKLNPVVVKEVFNRLLGTHAQENFTSPLKPAELLIALHLIDNKVDMKTIIKATNLCFSEQGIYTQEVLALVLQHLMEQQPLPTLFMRTVLQALAMHPKLIGFVMNILQRLILKQVWKQKKVWEGFVKCCQRTKPQSFQVVLQLPAPVLKSLFEMSPDLREPILSHVHGLTPHQRAHIPKAIMSVLERDPNEELMVVEQARREEEERRAAQEKIYQEQLEEERKKHGDKVQPLENKDGTTETPTEHLHIKIEPKAAARAQMAAAMPQEDTVEPAFPDDNALAPTDTEMVILENSEEKENTDDDSSIKQENNSVLRHSPRTQTS